ncbi:MAG TPA: alpha/beta hydrolase [Asanoa sp.]
MRDFRWPPPPDGSPRTYGPGPTAPRTGRPTLPQPATELVATPHGVRLEWLITGVGSPTTVFAHGLAGGIPTTRPLGSAVDGRRVFFHFRGHGRSDAPPGSWTNADLARDLRAVADLSGATRALGVSMGASALARLVADSPSRFDRLVFFLPASLDRPRPKPSWQPALLEAVEEGDAAAVADALSAELPPNLRGTPAVWAYLRQRVDDLLRYGLAPQLEHLAGQAAIADPAALRGVRAEALVIAAEDDDAHPVGVARDLAAELPHAALHVYDRPSLLWTHRADLRERISSFLNR